MKLKYNSLKYTFYIFLIAVGFNSCSKDDASNADVVDTYVGDYKYASSSATSADSYMEEILKNIDTGLRAIEALDPFNIKIEKVSANAINLTFKNSSVDISSSSIAFSSSDLTYTISDRKVLDDALPDESLVYNRIKDINGKFSTNNNVVTMTMNINMEFNEVGKEFVKTLSGLLTVDENATGVITIVAEKK